MTDVKAREIAERLIAEQHSPFRYDYIGVSQTSRFPNEMNVNFIVTSPEGKAFDGPVAIVVNELSEVARLFKSL